MKIIKKISKVILNKNTRDRLLAELQFKRMHELQSYIDMIQARGIKDEQVLLFSEHMLHTEEELWARCKQLLSEDGKRELYLVISGKEDEVFYQKVVKDGALTNKVSFIRKDSKHYYHLLATSKWLFSNGTLGATYIKRDGQVYVYDLCCDLEKQPIGLIAAIQQNLLAADVVINKREVSSIFYPETLLKKQEGKKNLLFYAGGLEKNGITSSLHSLLANVDLEANSYYVVVETAKVRGHEESIRQFPKQVHVLLLAPLDFTLKEKLCKVIYYRLKRINTKILSILQNAYERNFKRTYPCATIDRIVQFTGYESDFIEMYSNAPCKKYIYVHNNMVKEIETKGYQNLNTLRRAYEGYDGVLVVTKDILEITRSINPKGTYAVVNNCFNYQSVIWKADKAIAFDQDTESTHTLSQVEGILQEEVTKFITIGRFSAEKGHTLLLDAFDEYVRQGNMAYLFIIGGYGELYKQTVQKIQAMDCKDRIIVIKSMTNPMPILKRCNLFILSSLYEGLGLTLLEADTLKLPVISTDIEGPRGFMTKYHGCLVEKSKEGILHGIELYKENSINVMNVDYKEYNKQAIEEFYKSLELV